MEELIGDDETGSVPAMRIETTPIIYYLHEIERLREKMIDAARKLGLQHPTVLQYSKKIDETHNILLRIEHSNSKED